jgi:hypothetical protein
MDSFPVLFAPCPMAHAPANLAHYLVIIITRFQSEDQVCISTTLRELDKSVLTQAHYFTRAISKV